MSESKTRLPDQRQALLQGIPSITELLKRSEVEAWLKDHPSHLVTNCLRQAVAQVREQVLADSQGACGSQHVTSEAIVERAGVLLRQAITPHIRLAINATGIILHTGLGRAVLSASVVDSILAELKGYCTLAVDVATGERAERDELVEYILTELTGAEAATVVNNNAAATMLVLAANKDLC